MITSSVKPAIDGISLTVVLSALLDHMPAYAALASLIWACIRIYETRTVQRWLGRNRNAEK